jgi:hypothetical protein
MNDAPLMNAYEELGMLLADPRVPEDIRAACLRLCQCPTKIFSTVPEGYRAGDYTRTTGNAGTANVDGWALRLEPSDLFRESSPHSGHLNGQGALSSYIALPLIRPLSRRHKTRRRRRDDHIWV